jgi:hypothetical protein
VTATDKAGNATVVKETVQIKKPPPPKRKHHGKRGAKGSTKPGSGSGSGAGSGSGGAHP